MSDPGWRIFFDEIREPIFGGSIPESAVKNIHIILNEAIRQDVSDFRHFSYILSTSRGEVGRALEPVREGFGDDAKARRDVAWLFRKGKISRNYALPHALTGQCYYGRGYPQTTHIENYEWADEYTGLPLLTEPDLMLRSDVAAKVMVYGMVHGKFTGKKLSDYLYGRTFQWQNARRIINGTDRAAEFASFAKAFNRALWLAFPDGKIPIYEEEEMTNPASEQPIPAAHPPVVTAPKGSFANGLLTGAVAWLGARLFGGSDVAGETASEPANAAFDACFAAIQSGGLTTLDFMILGGAALLAAGKIQSPILGRMKAAFSVLTGAKQA